jgi:hypothetical protein
MTRTVANRGGQKPRAGVRRYPGGQVHHADRVPLESEEDVKATVLEARLRRELGVEAWMAARGTPKGLREARRPMDEPLMGSALGRLLLVGRKNAGDGISQAQHEAGDYFVRLYRARGKLSGWPSPNVRAIDYGATVGGLSVHPEDSPEWIADIKRRWETMNRAVFDVGAGEVYEILKRVLIEDRGAETMDELGALRLGLNAINRARGV